MDRLPAPPGHSLEFCEAVRLSSGPTVPALPTNHEQQAGSGQGQPRWRNGHALNGGSERLSSPACPVFSLPPPTPESSPTPCARTGQIPLTRAWATQTFHPRLVLPSSWKSYCRPEEGTELRSHLGYVTNGQAGGSKHKLSLPSLSSSKPRLPCVLQARADCHS